MDRPTLSLVLPIFNEEEVLPELHRRLVDFLTRFGPSCEVVFVNDGSTDRSLELVRDLARADARFKVLSFSRNFGHQAAISAGIDHARGKAVVVMDADLQDPPEVIVDMVAKWQEGFDVVYAQRRRRAHETWFKRLTAGVFYRVFALMIPIDVPLDTGDFRLMSRRVIVTLRALGESHRFVRGLVAWVGFRQAAVFYDRPGRFAGDTKYPVGKMIRFALDGITSFSMLPLRFSTYLGIFLSSASLLYAGFATVAHYVFLATVPGWTALVVLVSLLSSAQLLMIGILGEYLGRIYEQVKARPLYVVGERVNVTADTDDVDTEGTGRRPETTITVSAPPRAPFSRPSRGRARPNAEWRTRRRP